MKKAIIALCLLILCIPSMVYADSNVVTISESTYSYYKDGQPAGYNKHAVFTSSTGNPVYCGNHGLSTSVGENIGDSKVLEMYEYDNDTVRKVLYYGYLGPKEWEGFSDPKYNGVYKAYTVKDKRKWCGNAVTGMALTKSQGKGYLYNISGFEEFWEYISNAPVPPKGFKSYIMYGGKNYQDLFTWSYNPIGQLKLSKSISNDSQIVEKYPKIYSLENGEYAVSLDREFKSIVGRLATDKTGETNLVSLKPGTYYVKETKAPKGFKLDEQIYTVSVDEDEVNTLKVEDKPLYNSMDLLLLKTDSKTGKGIEDGIFEVNYYDQLTKNLSGKKPEKTWIFKTDDKGRISLDESYKIGGDELFKNEEGKAVGLIGTYEIKEVKAPKGYARYCETIICQVTQDEYSSNTIYNPPTIENTKQTVSIILQKRDKNAVGTEPVSKNVMSLNGAIYQVKDNKGNIIGKIETDINGIGILANIDPGEYIIKEIKAPSGYLLNPEEIIVNCELYDDVMETLEFYVEVEDSPTKVEIVKYEEKDGVKVPLAGVTLQIINQDNEVVIEFETTNMPKEILYLPVGKYILREINTPKGYHTAKDIVFEVKDDAAVTKVEMENKAIELPPKEHIPLTKDWNNNIIIYCRILMLLAVILGIFFIYNLQKKSEKIDKK